MRQGNGGNENSKKPSSLNLFGASFFSCRLLLCVYLPLSITMMESNVEGGSGISPYWEGYSCLFFFSFSFLKMRMSWDVVVWDEVHVIKGMDTTCYALCFLFNMLWGWVDFGS